MTGLSVEQLSVNWTSVPLSIPVVHCQEKQYNDNLDVTWYVYEWACKVIQYQPHIQDRY